MAADAPVFERRAPPAGAAILLREEEVIASWFDETSLAWLIFAIVVSLFVGSLISRMAYRRDDDRRASRDDRAS